VLYILHLLAKLKKGPKKDKEKNEQRIKDLLTNEITLRSKRELIEKFIQENLPQIKDPATIPIEFDKFVTAEKLTAINELCEKEGLQPDKVKAIIDNFLFTERTPLPDEIVEAMNTKPKLLERKKLVPRITDDILRFVEKYITGMPSDGDPDGL
jgi:type I restriction enzyme, R subunit